MSMSAGDVAILMGAVAVFFAGGYTAGYLQRWTSKLAKSATAQ